MGIHDLDFNMRLSCGLHRERPRQSHGSRWPLSLTSAVSSWVDTLNLDISYFRKRPEL
jgi:hypothetical protein